MIVYSICCLDFRPVGYFGRHLRPGAHRKFETNIPRIETAQPRSQFLHLVSASDLHIPWIGLPILLQKNRWTDPGNRMTALSWVLKKTTHLKVQSRPCSVEAGSMSCAAP
jgi:hypothetical protein